MEAWAPTKVGPFSSLVVLHVQLQAFPAGATGAVVAAKCDVAAPILLPPRVAGDAHTVAYLPWEDIAACTSSGVDAARIATLQSSLSAAAARGWHGTVPVWHP